MAFVHGKNAHFTIDDSGGTPRNLSAFLTEVTFPRQMDMAETSVFGNTYKTYIQGLGDASLSISGRWDPTATTGPDAVLSGLIGAATASDFSYGPAGDGSGAIEFTGSVYLTSYEISASINDVISFSAQFQMASQITRGTFA
jgi:hypothetical protein